MSAREIDLEAVQKVGEWTSKGIALFSPYRWWKCHCTPPKLFPGLLSHFAVCKSCDATQPPVA